MAKRDKNATLIITVLSVVAFLISYSYLSSIYKSYEVQIQEKNLKKEIITIEDENNRIKKQLDYITTPSFIEREAKRELGLKKPGEKVYIIKDNTNIISTDEKENSLFWEKLSGPERWLHFFIKTKENEKSY